METREIIKGVLNQFFLIFTVITISMLATVRLSALDAVPISDIIGALILAALTSLAGIVMYSKRDLRRSEALVRSAIHLFIVMVMCLTIATIFGWLSWNTPVEVALYIALFLAVYLIISLIDYVQTKKLADDLNAKLKQRYKS